MVGYERIAILWVKPLYGLMAKKVEWVIVVFRRRVNGAKIYHDEYR